MDPVTSVTPSGPASSRASSTPAWTSRSVWAAAMRVTNGYNTGISGTYQSSASIYLERLTP